MAAVPDGRTSMMARGLLFSRQRVQRALHVPIAQGPEGIRVRCKIGWPGPQYQAQLS
jgi:hypothetical protein